MRRAITISSPGRPYTDSAALKKQKAVTVYLKSKQLAPYGFAWRRSKVIPAHTDNNQH